MVVFLFSEKAKEKPSVLGRFRGGSPARLLLLLALINSDVMYAASLPTSVKALVVQSFLQMLQPSGDCNPVRQ